MNKKILFKQTAEAYSLIKKQLFSNREVSLLNFTSFIIFDGDLI